MFIVLIFTMMLIFAVHTWWHRRGEGDSDDEDGTRPAPPPLPTPLTPPPHPPARADCGGEAHPRGGGVGERRRRPPNPPGWPRPGQLVLLTGLVARPDLNGTLCKAGRALPGGERLRVRALGSPRTEHLAVRPACALPLPPAGALNTDDDVSGKDGGGGGPAVVVATLACSGECTEAVVRLGAAPTAAALAALRSRLAARLPLLRDDARVASFELARLGGGPAREGEPGLCSLAAFEALHAEATAAAAGGGKAGGGGGGGAPLRLAAVVQAEAPETGRGASPLSDLRLWPPGAAGAGGEAAAAAVARAAGEAGAFEWMEARAAANFGPSALLGWGGLWWPPPRNLGRLTRPPPLPAASVAVPADVFAAALRARMLGAGWRAVAAK